MMRLLAKLRNLRDDRRASVPLQYAMVAAVTGMVAMMIVEANKRVVEKLNAISSALDKIQF